MEIAFSLRRRLKDFSKRCIFRLHRIVTRCGWHILPAHYYSALPNVLELETTRPVWARKSKLVGIQCDLNRQIANLEHVVLPFQSEYAGNPSYLYATSNHFGPGYGYVEAQALHGFLRHFEPRTVVEVGSGVSTYCMIQALKLNQSAGEFKLTCVEPFPSAALRKIAGIELIQQPVQQVPLGLFESLQSGDFLFIDSSHAVNTGSDVNHLFLEVLPRLNRGVLVHIHDINLPYDYSRSTLKTFIHPMETALLHAYLVGNTSVEILFSLSMLHYDAPKTLKTVFPEYVPQAGDSGLWPDDAVPFVAPPHHFPSSIYLRM